ncbi:uncharacterized protein JN550_005687 [Neoarthrinium moseri]|uniref:uncharacterized protein n=1 Tax=Neoarthrinium moseri TaxID=1658444 RepID=UPI001FDC2AFD|nr:uncharacterized protein JN550_005687 [Neoarthrinium moseri]KAI1869706.1 hypothetical protein JN550_005687 [Neoarthrinium moseri]
MTEPKQPATAGPDSPSSISMNEKSDTYAAFSKEDFLSPDFRSDHINIIVREGIILGAGAQAILLQVANAGVGAGVNEHSNFAYRVQDRLRTTMTFVYCMSFGTPQEKKTIVDMITAVHKNVTGTLNEGRDKGKTYSALDPKLQLWVAATLYATGLPIYERVFGKITNEDLHEKIYREYSILACALQVPPEMWPRTRKDFWAYWDHEIATIEVTQHARDIAKDLLYLRQAPWHIRMLTPAVRLCTAEWLPERIRAEYGVKRHPRRYRMLERLVRATYPALPLSVRSYPVKLYMNDMRERLANKRAVIGKDA